MKINLDNEIKNFLHKNEEEIKSSIKEEIKNYNELKEKNSELEKFMDEKKKKISTLKGEIKEINNKLKGGKFVPSVVLKLEEEVEKKNKNLEEIEKATILLMKIRKKIAN